MNGAPKAVDLIRSQVELAPCLMFTTANAGAISIARNPVRVPAAGRGRAVERLSTDPLAVRRVVDEVLYVDVPMVVTLAVATLTLLTPTIRRAGTTAKTGV